MELIERERGDISGQVILDVACGSGANAYAMGKRWKENQIIGVDINEQLIALGQERTKDTPNLVLKALDFSHLPNTSVLALLGEKGLGDSHSAFRLSNNPSNKPLGVTCFQTLSWLSHWGDCLKSIVSLQPQWICFNSLFYEGPLDYEIKVTDLTMKAHVHQEQGLNGQETAPTKFYYNIYSLPAIKAYLESEGYEVIAEKFAIDIDLPKPKDGGLGTYTVNSEEGKLQFSGALCLPWYNVLAKKKKGRGVLESSCSISPSVLNSGLTTTYSPTIMAQTTTAQTTTIQNATTRGAVMKPLHPGRISSKALEYLKEVVEYGFGNSSGPGMGGRFERAFAAKFGMPHAIAHSNGTATMHSCLAALGVKPGDEVITTPLTAAATAYCILHQGAIPIFADIDEKTFNINPESIRKRITPLTKAIIPVHLYGLPADMDAIMEIAREYNLAVIEDSAECFYAKYKGKLAGTIGHAASFSFQSSKHLTCGDGGVVLTNDEALATKIRKFSCFGYHTLTSKSGGVLPKTSRGDPTSIRHDSMGWNYRMSDLQAAVALEQTERIEEFVERRMKIGAMFLEAVQGCSFLIPQYTPPDCVNSYWTFVCRFEEAVAGIPWQEFRERFYRFGGDFIYGAWRLSYNEPIFQNRNFLGGFFPIDSEIYKGRRQEYKPGLCPVAEKLQPKLMQFKTNYMNLDDARRMAEALKMAIQSCR